jgi:hypothetical protein
VNGCARMCTELQWDFTAVDRFVYRLQGIPFSPAGMPALPGGLRFEPRYLGCYEGRCEFYHLFTGVCFLSGIMRDYVKRSEMEFYRT